MAASIVDCIVAVIMGDKAMVALGKLLVLQADD